VRVIVLSTVAHLLLPVIPLSTLSLTPSVFLSPPSSHLLAHAVQHRLIAIRGIATVTETIGAPLSLCLCSILQDYF